MALFDKTKIAWLGSIVLIEYKALKIVRPGPPDPAKLDTKEVTPQTARERYALELVEKVKNG
jgi:hypothetical protein